jgi:5,10-methylenetetrahydrofolate reductase
MLGAAALGVKNILCLTGDDVSQGDHPEAKPVFDLDAVSLLRVARGMCEQGTFASGRKLAQAPDFFMGATVNPFVPPHLDRLANLEQKIDAGARFIQTQFCFDLALFDQFMHAVRARGLHHRAHFLVGVGTLSSAKALKWMGKHVPGVHIPTAFLQRIAAADNQALEAQRCCSEMIRALAQIEGVAGVHVMGHRNEDVLAAIITEARHTWPMAPASAPEPIETH